MTSNFRPAQRHTVKARIGISGPSGSGKTYTALAIATGLADGGGIAVLDTENGSASLYADDFTFDVVELGPPFSPARYVELMKEGQRDHAVLIIDSASHAWSGEGGVLAIVDAAGARNRGNKWAGWKEGTPAQNSFLDAIIRSTAHVIVTMRSKTAYAQETEGGQTVIRKLGLEPIQREGIDFEFSVFAEMDFSHAFNITKSRLKTFQDQRIVKPGVEFGRTILAELQGSTSEATRRGSGDASGVDASSGEAPIARGLGHANPEQPTPEHRSAEAKGISPTNGTTVPVGAGVEAGRNPASAEHSSGEPSTPGGVALDTPGPAATEATVTGGSPEHHSTDVALSPSVDDGGEEGSASGPAKVTEPSDSPHLPVNLLKALHAIGKELGYDHAGLQKMCGVASLNDLSEIQARKWIDALQRKLDRKKGGA